MGWREGVLTRLGPGILAGISLGDWIRLLVRERFAVAPSCLPRALSITAQSLKNTAWRAIECRRFAARLREAAIQPPLFVLGHWRSGTTHLHNLLCVDRRFAFPNNYQVSFPHSFLSTEAADSRLVSFFLPPRRPMDNLEWTMASPQEDEFALCAATQISPCMGWVFPARREAFARYLTMRDASPRELAAWRRAFELFLGKLSLKHGRPLVLKSPPHTARIRLLLEVFPTARFIHISRHPHVVFQSSRHMFTVTSDWHRLQRNRPADLDEWVIRQYRQMYDAYFEERSLVPPGRLWELRFEDLEADPLGQLQRAYARLGLPGFEVVRPELERYVASLEGYRKNAFEALPQDLRSRLAAAWRRSFEEWGYDP